MHKSFLFCKCKNQTIFNNVNETYKYKTNFNINLSKSIHDTLLIKILLLTRNA